MAALDASAERHAPGKHIRMPSGAGHDAQWLARKLPAAMMFVPSIGGISHHWSENTSDEDLVLGAQVFTDARSRKRARKARFGLRNYLTGQRIPYPCWVRNFSMSDVSQGSGGQAARKLKSRLGALTMKRLGLRYISTDALTIRRRSESATATPSSRRAAAPSRTRSRARA